MSETPTADSQPLRDKRILVVEDEFMILLDIQGILESAGAKSIIMASHVDDAMTAIANNQNADRFDAAVLDLKLDKDSAIPIAERLAKLGIPFIFLTGSPDNADLAQDLKSTPVVGKPFDSATLLAALERAISETRSRRR
jgi:CheY-like chemotaxis protein